ncbi:MAG TPA: hypothetical protein VFE78_21920 [Gemmataceae bacterium]|nr:hypothetical protein [Gemmataceae bacterium]
MGGPGSGCRFRWWRKPKKDVVELCPSLDSASLTRGLRPGQARRGTWRCLRGDALLSVGYCTDLSDPARPHLRLDYTWVGAATGQEGSAGYEVALTATRLCPGQVRWWFRCPYPVGGRPCGRRVRKLYLPRSARYFGCRTCYELTYSSCQASRKRPPIFRQLDRLLREERRELREALREYGLGLG